MKLETVLLAGGCFWGMEDLFRKIPGVVFTDVGYTGGKTKDPTYNDVKKGNTGHAEALKVEYDADVTNYRDILLFFFKVHDPTTVDQQGNDIGSQYRSAIFYLNDEQKRVAEEVISLVNQSRQWPKPVVTKVEKATEFYRAEDYHQDYLERYPEGYTCHYVRPIKFPDNGIASSK